MKTLFSCFVLATCSFVTLAQPSATAQKRNGVAAVLPEGDKANPCANLGNPPTVASCWNCFQSLLADCDRQNPEGNRRKACYDGANNFFTWCLGRVALPVNPANPNAPRREGMIRGAGFTYDIAFSAPVDPTSIVVYVRDMEFGQPRMQMVKSFVFANSDGSLSVFFDNNNLGLDDDSVVGIVTTCVNLANGAVEAAYADAYNIITPCDLNGDGIVDEFDLIRAWEIYSVGEMSFDEFIEFLRKHESR